MERRQKIRSKVTQESENDKDVPFTNSKGETVYTLSATTRDREGAIMMPKDRILCLTSETVDLSDIEVLIDDSNEQAKKDLELSLYLRLRIPQRFV